VHLHDVDPSPVIGTDAWDQWFKQSAGEWDEASVEALLGGRRD
jgi:hypothetical protein